MDDFAVFFKNDKNFVLKQLHFILSLVSFLFLILTNTIDSVIVALAIPGSVINSAILLGQYCLDDRHDFTDIEILITYGTFNLLAAMVFVNKTLQRDLSIFRMLFLNTFTINIILCLLSGLLMLGEGIYRLILLLVRNIYNSTHNSQHLNLLFNGKDPTSALTMSTLHKIIITPDVDMATNTSPSVSNVKMTPQNVRTYAEKDTNTNPYEDVLLRRTTQPWLGLHPIRVDNYTECSHYRLNSKHDKHQSVTGHNSGDNGYMAEAAAALNDKRSGDGAHCAIETEKKLPVGPTQFFYPKTHRHMRLPKSLNSQNSGFNEAGLPVFVDRYGKRYIASLAGGADTHRCSANTTPNGNASAATRAYDDGNTSMSTPIDEFYTNRKYSNSKVTLTPSKDEVTANDGIISDSKVTQDTTNATNTNITHHNHNHNNHIHNDNNSNVNDNNNNNNDNRVTNNLANNKNKADSNEYVCNYNNYLAHLYKNNDNNNNNNGKKMFNYKFYNHNYDYQWVCEA